VFNIGPEEIILLLVVALVFLGPNRLPEVARQIGKGLREFRSLSARARAELLQNVNLNEITDDLKDDETLPPLDVPALEAAALEASALEEAKDPSPNGKPKKKKGPKRTPVGAGNDSAEANDVVPSADGVPAAEGSLTEDGPTQGSPIDSPVGSGAKSPEGATIDAAPTEPAPIGSDTGSTEVSG
jgi:Tat protein translocase TatB subunit